MKLMKLFVKLMICTVSAGEVCSRSGSDQSICLTSTSSKIAVILIHFHYNQLSIFPVQSTELRCLLLIVNSAVKTEPIKTLGDH